MSLGNNSEKLLVDRVEFKLHTAEHHLNNLKEIELISGDLSKGNIVRVEMEIDCFLAQIVGAIDALLVQINMTLGLGIAIDKADIYSVQSALSAKTKSIDLLTELNQAANHDNWFWLLKELRTQSMHRTMLRRMRDYNSFDERIRVFIPKQQRKRTVNPDDYMQIELIQYFQESIQKVRELVNTIRLKEPILKEKY